MSPRLVMDTCAAVSHCRKALPFWIRCVIQGDYCRAAKKQPVRCAFAVHPQVLLLTELMREPRSRRGRFVRIRFRRHDFLHVFAAHAMRPMRIVRGFVFRKDVLISRLFFSLPIVDGLILVPVRMCLGHGRLLSLAFSKYRLGHYCIGYASVGGRKGFEAGIVKKFGPIHFRDCLQRER